MALQEGVEISEVCQVYIPKIAQQAAHFVAAVETAGPETPVSFDMLADDSLERTWNTWVKKDDELYDRHEELFFSDESLVEDAPLHNEAILDLSRDIIREMTAQRKVWLCAALGLGALQLAAAGANLARNPDLALIDQDCGPAEILPALAEKAASIEQRAFQQTFLGRIKGNFAKMPNLRCEYIGQLLSQHLAFWMESRAREDMNAEIQAKVQKLLPQFPAKAYRFNAHAMKGSPSREVARRAYLHKINAFHAAAQAGESHGLDVRENISDALAPTFSLLDSAIQRGYSPAASLRLAVQKTSDLAQLTRHARVFEPSKDAVCLVGDYVDPTLQLHFSKIAYGDTFGDKAKATLHRRSQLAGLCPTRYPVRLNRGGETHKNLAVFSEAVLERLGAVPPVLIEAGDNLYADVGALTVDYVLLVTADNYHNPDPQVYC